MNLEGWMEEVRLAYSSQGREFGEETKRFLLQEIPENPTDSEEEAATEAIDAILRYFFLKASRGEAFGSVDRIKKELGSSIEEQYRIKDGVFSSAATVYWSFRIELEDVRHQYSTKILVHALGHVLMAMSWLFVPSADHPGRSIANMGEEQRRFLLEYAPDMRIDEFVRESPLLGP